MIVKVQISLASSDNKKQMLVYNKSRNVMYEDAASPEILKLIRNRPKAYFNAEVVNTKIVLDDEVEQQNW